MAMRARQEAGQGARAATLAGQALLRYGSDAKTRELAEGIVSAESPKLHRLDVRCTRPCVVALSDRAVPGQPRTRWRLYVEPGEVSVSASFTDGGADQQVINAQAGGNNALSFVAAVSGSPSPDPKPSQPVADGDGSDLADTRSDGPPDDIDDDAPSWIQHPGVFVSLIVATAGVGGVTIWSGVDTIKNPGTERVRQECAGEGSDCELYQEGRRKQLRTNILIGATAGTAALAAVFGIFITEWGGGDEAPVEAGIVATPDGAGFSFGGRF
jgi:hypothetical protein